MDPGCQLWEVEEGECDEHMNMTGSTDRVCSTDQDLYCLCYVDSPQCNQQRRLIAGPYMCTLACRPLLCQGSKWLRVVGIAD